MLKKISIGEGWKYYKREQEIRPGIYLTGIRKPTQEEKKIYEMIPASPPTGGFMWLLPCEKWVIESIQGRLEKNRKITEPDWSLIKINPDVLRPWQRQAITEAYSDILHTGSHRKGWIVSLGGGKTLTGLCIAQMFENPVVLADKYLHGTWKAEAKKWNLDCPIVTTYESAHKIKTPDALIIDECIRIKSPLAQRSQRIREISKNVELVVGLTGIPTAGKKALDFRWLRCIDPECVPETEIAWQFRFGLDTELKEVGGNKAYVTSKWNDKEIAEFISPYVSTVDTSELIKHLPEIEERYIDCPKPSQYDMVARGVATTKGTMKRLAQIRQSTDGFIYDDNDQPQELVDTASKISRIKDFVENLGEPVIIFSAWTKGVELLAEAFKENYPAVVTGGNDNSYEISKFLEGKTDILISNSRFSSGFNAQERCRIILFASLSTKPDDLAQCKGRIYRPGQKKGCIVVYFVCQDTLDRRVIDLVKEHSEATEGYIEQLLLKEIEENLAR